MENGFGNGFGNGGARLAPRMTVRHGAASLLAAEAALVAAWILLWATFLVAVSPPRRLAGAERPAAAQVEAQARPAALDGRRG
jgi:hypothetical protein